MEDEQYPWVWWHRHEHEDDLSGFHTAEDRDAFQAGHAGPFRRRVCSPAMKSIPQNEDWDAWMQRKCDEANIPRSKR